MNLTYTIQRSTRRKKLTITVEHDRSILVHAPQSATDESIHLAVESSRQWLFTKLNHPRKYQLPAHPPGKGLVNGESALYLGQEYRIEIAETPSGQIEFSRGFRIPSAIQAKGRPALRDWYIVQAKQTILPKVAQRARELGVVYSGAKVVDSRYQCGSCTVKNNITFNWRLIKAPPFVVDYIIVNELAHLLEGNHTAAFWNIVRANAAAMEKAKAWLRENGQLLEQEL